MNKSVDWTVGISTWPPDVADEVVLTSTVPPSLAAIAMTTWQEESAAGLGPEVFSPAPSLTVERIRGQIHIDIDSQPNATAWGWVADLRLRIGESDAGLGGLPTLPASYDLRDATWANESFLWHHTHWVTNYGTWYAGSDATFGAQATIDVDVRVKRRLEQYQQLQLVVQWSLRYGITPSQRLRVSPNLRVLYRG